VNNDNECEIRFLPEGKRSRVRGGSSIMAAALKGGVDLANICGGKGFCAKCLVEVIEGELSPVSEHEKKRVPPEKLSKGYRMACQARVSGNVVVRVPDQSRIGRQRLVIMGKEPPVRLRPNVLKVFCELSPPTLENPVADDINFLRALGAMERGADADVEVFRKLPKVLREGGWKVTATLVGGRIVNIQPGREEGAYGVAVDIGTTKLAVFIVDLSDGNIVFADGIMNPQIRFGEDVISRLQYASQGRAAQEEIRQTITNGINELISKGLAETEIKQEDLYEMVVVGNTAMHHLFVGVDVGSLGLSPYPAGLGRPYDFRARDLGIGINPSGSIHVLPNVAGFVGADAIADILAAKLHEKERLTLLMDVGTNTEVMLGNRDGIWSCSTASGPAFEGAHISCGMRAASGAIEKVKITEDGDVVSYKTIDDEKPRGICGSAIIDAVAEMLRSGVMNASGSILPDGHRRVRQGPSGREYVLAYKEETASGREDIVVTQNDVREVQKAKAAMFAGYATLMRKSGFHRNDLSEIIIAGAFGSYIDPESARTIGMIPEVPLDRISFIGNTAGSGARMCLKSLDAREDARRVSESIKYVELASDPIFEEEYVNAMYLPNSALDEFPEIVAGLKAPLVVKRYIRR